MEIKEITNKREWEEFLLLCDRKTFLHSWNWGEFQKSLGNPPSPKASTVAKAMVDKSEGRSKIWRYGIYNDEELISVVLVVKHTAKRGSFLLIPHGPVININSKHISNQPSGVPTGPASELEICLKEDIIKIIVNRLKDLSKEEKVDFIRISPIWERSDENTKLFRDLGFRLRPLHTHPESSWKLNIEKPEEELLARMRKTTRYLIRQAEKSEVEVFQSFDLKDVEVFNEMHREVVKHQKFVPFSFEYFKKEFQAFFPDKQIALFFAKYSPPHQTKKDCAKLGHKIKPDSPLWCGGKGKIIAASYGIFWSNVAFYHHAALLPEYKKIPAAYLLQWEAIKEAKKRGCKIYDFWGYSDPKKNPNHPYSGPTLFKMGFGGYREEYVKTQDLVISPKYWLNYIIETGRKIKRGLY